jgi:hypothetical protein
MGIALPRRLGRRLLLKAELHHDAKGVRQSGLLEVGTL